MLALSSTVEIEARREQITEMLTLEYPDKNPGDLFIEIVKSLDVDGSNVWGLPLKPLTLAVLRSVLEGVNAEQTVARLSNTGDGEPYSPQSVEAEYRQLRARPAFEALFTKF